MGNRKFAIWYSIRERNIKAWDEWILNNEKEDEFNIFRATHNYKYYTSVYYGFFKSIDRIDVYKRLKWKKESN